MLDSTYRLLAFCARVQGHPAFYAELKTQLSGFTAWKELPAQAEAQGIAPLLWHHLRNSGADVPEETARILRGLYLRHRVNNQIHAAVLLDMLEIFSKAGIQPLVLKGLALAYQYYPDPALRPISDIDLLFKQDQVLTALRLLADAGYQVQLPTSKKISKSIVITAPARDGISVSIEAHHYDPKGRAPDGTYDDEFINLDSPPVPVKMNNGTFYAPAPLEHLLYLSRHLARHMLDVTAERPLQLKWAADMLSVVERHADSLDWSDLKQNHSDLINRLEFFYSLTPMPDSLRGLIPVRQIPPPADCNQYPSGWPQHKIWMWKRFGFWRFLRQTFTIPSGWWLQLYYGIDERKTFWYGLLYLLQVPRLMFWAIMDSIGW